MGTRTFTEEELSEYISENAVQESEHGHGRWEAHMTTVFEADDGKLYKASWGKGLTEYQENTYYDLELEEVFALSQVKAKMTTDYVNAEEYNLKSSSTLLDVENVQASKLISDDAATGITALEAFDTTDVLAFLEAVSPAVLSKTDGAFLGAAKEFFTAVARVQAELD